MLLSLLSKHTGCVVLLCLMNYVLCVLYISNLANVILSVISKVMWV